MAPSEALRAQAAQAYRTACALARSNQRELAAQAMADTYRLVAQARTAREAEDAAKKGAAA